MGLGCVRRGSIVSDDIRDKIITTLEQFGGPMSAKNLTEFVMEDGNFWSLSTDVDRVRRHCEHLRKQGLVSRTRRGVRGWAYYLPPASTS